MPQTSKKTILIADDNDGIVASLTMMLEYSGYLVRSVTQGANLMPLTQPLPDLVLLDIRMAGINGLDVCTYLKSDPKCKHLPIVMMSAMPDSSEQALAAGADAFIEKPYNMELMLGAIRKFLNVAPVHVGP